MTKSISEQICWHSLTSPFFYLKLTLFLLQQKKSKIWFASIDTKLENDWFHVSMDYLNTPSNISVVRQNPGKSKGKSGKSGQKPCNSTITEACNHNTTTQLHPVKFRGSDPSRKK